MIDSNSYYLYYTYSSKVEVKLMAYKSNATDIVFDFITKKIREREWVSNTRIWSETELCKQLHVSRIAVRQAIEKFTTMNVLRKLQGSGTYVNDIKDFSLIGLSYVNLDIDAVISLLEFRKIIEPASVQMFIERATEAEFEDLSNCLKKMEENKDAVKDYYHYDFKFHSIIVNATKNPYMIKVYALFEDFFELHQQMLTQSVGPASGVFWHSQILKYIQEKNVELAVAFSRQHVEHSIQRYKQSLGETKIQTGPAIPEESL